MVTEVIDRRQHTGRRVVDAVAQLVEASPDGTAVVGEDGTLLYVNRQLEHLTGFDRADLIGQSVDLLVPDGARAHHRALREDFARDPCVRAMGSGVELDLVRMDGTTVPVEIALAPAKLAARDVVIATVRDVSEQRQADRARRRLLRLLDLVVDSVLIVNAETMQVEYANPAATQILGYSADELTAMTLWEFAPSLTEQGRLDMLARVGQGTQTNFCVTRRDKWGRDIPFDSRVQCVIEGDEPKFIAVERDARPRLSDEHARDRRLRVTSLMAEVTAMVLADTKPHSIYQCVAEGLAGLLDCENTSMVVTDPETGEIETIAAVGPAARLHQNGGVVLDDEALSHWNDVELNGVIPGPPPDQPDALSRLLGPGIICTLPGPERDDGVLTAFRAKGRPTFTDAEVELLHDVARQVSTILELGRARADQQRLAVIDDRERIGRELHDTTIQELFAFGMELASGQRTITDEHVRERDARLLQRLDRTVRRLRAMIFDTRQPGEFRTVSEAVRSTVAEAGRAFGTNPVLTLHGPVNDLPHSVTEHLIPVLREALSNMIRHAGASAATVTLTVRGTAVELKVEDNGDGPPAEPKAGEGLRNMAQRAAILGGTAELLERSTGGSCLTWMVTVPSS